MTFLIAVGSLKTPGYYSSHVLLLPLLLLLLLDGEWICNEHRAIRVVLLPLQLERTHALQM